MNAANTIKALLAASVVTAISSSAHASLYIIGGGALTGITNTASTLVLNAYGSPWIAQTVASAQAVAIQPHVQSAVLDIAGSFVNSGSITIDNYAVKTFLNDSFGTTMDTSAVTYSFGASYGAAGFAQTAGGVVVGSCKDGDNSPATGASALICPSAYVGMPALDYLLSYGDVVDGLQTLNLSLRLGTANPNISGGLTVMNFSLCASLSVESQCPAPPAETPVPAAAWLFGSGVLGLARLARRKATN